MTEHRPAMRIEVARVIAPDGREAVLIQTDDWHLLLPPGDAIEIGQAVVDAAVAILAERN